MLPIMVGKVVVTMGDVVALPERVAGVVADEGADEVLAIVETTATEISDELLPQLLGILGLDTLVVKSPLSVYIPLK